jgi:hypothetical protein
MEEPAHRDASHLRPGEVAPRSGIYQVRHYAHRLPHMVVILKGHVLPACKECGDRVRFTPSAPAEPLSKDRDFFRAAERRAA